jgi:hypothetical protein
MRPRRTALALASALVVVGGALAAPATSSAAAPAALGASALFTGNEGKFTPKAPTRIMDTRIGLGVAHHLGPAAVATLQVTGTSAVPSTGASTVVFNLTVTNPTSSGHITVYPSTTTRPNASNINFPRGWTGANLVTVTLGTTGKISFYNSSGTTDVIADVVGWYATSTAASATGEFQEVTPARLWDTRGHEAVGGGGTLTQPVNIEKAGVSANPNIKALVVTLTAVAPQTSGHLTAWSGSGAAPTASVLNYPAHTTTANLAIVPVAPCAACTGADHNLPSIKVLNASNGSTDLLIDIWGFYDDGTLADGLLFKPLSSPVRIADTRTHLGGVSTLSSASTRTVNAPGTVAGDPTHVLVQNVTSIPASNTFLTFWPNGSTRPVVSNISPRAGKTVAGLAYTGVGANNDFNFYNATGSNDVIVDVAGSLESHAAPKAQAQSQTTWQATAGSAR